MLQRRGGPAVQLIGSDQALKGVALVAAALNERVVSAKGRRERGEQVHQRVVDLLAAPHSRLATCSLRVEHLVGGEVHVEAARRGGNVDALLLEGDHVEVHQVALQLATSGRGVPPRGGEHLEGRWRGGGAGRRRRPGLRNERRQLDGGRGIGG